MNVKQHSFAEATAVKATSSHTYEANFPEDWCIGSVPHGGFITGCFLRVASAHFSSTLSSQSQPHTIALHLDFLRRTQTGPALFTVRDTKLGRQASVIQISLSQPSHGSQREEVIGTITQGNIPLESGVSYPTTWTLTPPPAPCNPSLLALDQDPNWTKQPSMPFASFRRATQKIEFNFPRSGQLSRSSADEWVRLSTSSSLTPPTSPPEKWTNASLGFLCDMWPMPVEALSQPSNPYSPNSSSDPPKAKFWYPTLLLNLDIKKALPDEGVEWLFVRVDSKVIKNGRMDLDIVIMDKEGDVVALSQHVAFAVDLSRNLAVRKPGGESKM